MATVSGTGVEPVITTQPSNEPKRRVSMANDPVTDCRMGYDNLGYDLNPRRKISQNSEHAEIGPVRKKSILVNNNNTQDADSLASHHSHDYRSSSYMSQHRRESISAHPEAAPPQQSWIYSLCMRCRVEYNTPSWEPKCWPKLCPYPLCPSFRQFSHILSLILIGILIWVTVYVIIGDTAAPGGQLFGLVVLTVAANFGGWLVSLTTLPRLIGMLLVGILFQNVGWVDLGGEFKEVTAVLRKFALCIILIRAGLEMDPQAFKRVYVTILKLGLIPWTVEAVVMAVMSHYLLNLPWVWAFALGAIIAAVSPAVVVPCLFRLRVKGYGVAKGIPTLIVAVAGIDDAASVAIFGIIASVMFSSGDLAYQIAQAPVCVIGGLAFGVVWGWFAKFVPEQGDAYAVPLRTLLLFGAGLLSIFGSEKIGFEGAGPLGVVFAAFVSNYFWCEQGWEIEDNPVATAFEIFWMIFEPILFGVTGAAVKINELDSHIVTVGVGCLVAGGVLRILATIAIAFGDGLNVKEKVFVALSWMAKATVQAALGPVILKKLTERGDITEEEEKYANIVLMICILSIVVTAPIGAILISITGTRLLTKTKQPPITEGWRRSHRPSLYDISIINEEEERDTEAAEKTITRKISQITNGSRNAAPIYTIKN